MNAAQQEVKPLKDRNYASLSPEELTARLREAFFCPDRIDDTICRELEYLQAALEEKQPSPDYDPEAAWERFLEDNAEELSELWGSEKDVQPEADRRPRKEPPKIRRFPSLLRTGLVAVVLLALLAGAALAAGGLGWDLRAWMPRWNAAAGRYEPASAKTEGSPIPAALAELGVTELVYPAKLPQGFVITESRISLDPLILVEQYACGDKRLSITVTPVQGFETVVFQQGGEPPQEYSSGGIIHYVFESENTVTAIWYTQHYATSISGNISRREIKGIITSIPEGAAG